MEKVAKCLHSMLGTIVYPEAEEVTYTEKHKIQAQKRNGPHPVE